MILDAHVIFRSDVSLVVGFALSEIRNRESVTVVVSKMLAAVSNLGQVEAPVQHDVYSTTTSYGIGLCNI